MGEGSRAVAFVIGILLFVGGLVASLWFAWNEAGFSVTCVLPSCSTNWGTVDGVLALFVAAVIVGVVLSLVTAYRMGKVASLKTEGR